MYFNMRLIQLFPYVILLALQSFVPPPPPGTEFWVEDQTLYQMLTNGGASYVFVTS